MGLVDETFDEASFNPTSNMNGSTAQKTLVPWCIYSLSFLH